MIQSKKILFPAVAGLLCLVLTGCVKTEISHRGFVQALAVDQKGGRYTVAVQVQSADTEGNFTREYFEGVGRTIPEAILKAEEKQTKKLFFGHCKVVAAGTGIKDLKNELACLQNGEGLSPRADLVLSDYGKDWFGQGEYDPFDFLQLAEEHGTVLRAELAGLYADETLLIPLGEKNKPWFGGCAVTENGKVVGRLTEEETRGAFLLLGELCRSKQPLLYETDAGTVWLDSADAEYLPVYRDEALTLKIILKLKGRTAGNNLAVSDEEALRRQAEQDCEAALLRSFQLNSDFLKLYERTYQTFPVQKEAFMENFQKLSVQLTVRCQLEENRKF